MYAEFPQYIQFYPTLRCNLACEFCFNRGIMSMSEVGPDNFERMLSIICDIGVKEIDILGGEPTLHPGFRELMEIACQRRMKTLISTNAHNNYQLLRELSERYDRALVTIGVSINTDMISGELEEYIIRYTPLVKSVFTKERRMPGAARKFLSLPGIDYFLIFMDPVFKADLKNTLPFYEFFHCLREIKTIHENVDGVYCSGFIPAAKSDPMLRHVRCPAGTTKLAITPEGSVFPCYLFFRNPEFTLGNILVDDFDRIWKNPVLDFFRNFQKNTCTKRNCRFHADCHGGCPAVSLLIYRDIRAPDPRCSSAK